MLYLLSFIQVDANQMKLFRREEDEESKNISTLSLDFDDPGDNLMTAQDDDTIQIYNVRTGTHSKKVLSKKYGVKLAKFTHTSACILYASTKSDRKSTKIALLLETSG